jgi:short-subunit dehydrogenase involved in D-alanine esterification of teichoic acids
MDDKLTVLITGTNKGIGCDLVRIFHKMNPNSVIIATSREEPKIAAKRWKQMGLNDRIICKQLDMKKYETILNCAI